MAMVEERSNKGARVEKVVKTWQRFGRYGRRHSRRTRTEVVVETAVRGAYHFVTAQAPDRRGAPTMMEPTRYTCKRLEGEAGLSAQSAGVFRTSRTSRTERLGLDSHELASTWVLGLNNAGLSGAPGRPLFQPRYFTHRPAYDPRKKRVCSRSSLILGRLGPLSPTHGVGHSASILF